MVCFKTLNMTNDIDSNLIFNIQMRAMLGGFLRDCTHLMQTPPIQQEDLNNND